MDRNSIVGIILIAVIFVVWGIFSTPSKEERAKMKHQQDSIALVRRMEAASENKDTLAQVSKEKQLTQLPDSLKNKALVGEYGVFADAAIDSNQFYTLENEKLKFTVSTKGGRPYSVELKEYHRYDSSKLVLFDGDSTVFGLNFSTTQNRIISSNDLYFKPLQAQPSVMVKKGDKPGTLTMRLYAGENRYIEYVYSLAPNDYMVGLKVNIVKLDSIIAPTSSLDLVWNMSIPGQDKGRQNENNYTNIAYKHFEDDVDQTNSRTKAGQVVDKNIPTRIKWVAFKQHFFSSILIAGTSFENLTVKQVTMDDSSKYLKNFNASMSIAYDFKSQFSAPFQFYFGPNHYSTLKSYHMDLEQVVPLGWSWLRWISKYFIIPVFNWLDNYIANYGIIILILTIIIKVILFPLTYKSYLSQARMRVLKPQIDEIHARIPKEKALERQQATMNLYKKAGVSPMGGCLPMLLQMPILFSMFYFFPSSIELRQKAFLWADDLSTYDSIIHFSFNIPLYGDHISLFTILMTITTLISMKMSNQAGMTDNQMPGMKTMMYIMPIVFMFALNNFSAGLTYYYFLANVFTIVQNEIFKRMIDEKKILAQIQANKAKSVKKSKFQERLEKMAKERGMKLPPRK